MSETNISPGRVWLVMLGVLGAAALAAVAGFWLGERSVKIDIAPPAPLPSSPAQPQADLPIASEGPAPPLYFLVTAPTGDPADPVLKEITMAAQTGIHQYVLSVPLSWSGPAPTDVGDAEAPLGGDSEASATGQAAATGVACVEALLGADPDASAMLRVNLNPPGDWLTAHPEAAAAAGGGALDSVSLASPVWREEAARVLDVLLTGVEEHHPGIVTGCVIACLDSGQWSRDGARDVSDANTDGFRRWLRARYGTDGALQRAWSDVDASLDKTAIPAGPANAEGGGVFLSGPAAVPELDFRRYSAEVTAEAIAQFATHIKAGAGEGMTVLAPYGYTFEAPGQGTAHFALAKLLDGPLDGFVSAVSRADRGLGGVGGMMGPVESAKLHGKRWCLVDDTRTGIARDETTGELTRPKSIRAEDVYHVQQRNFAAAVAHGLGLFWSDLQGEGRLHDAEMWQRFGEMRAIYSTVNSWSTEGESPLAPHVEGPTLAVVVDEESRLHMNNAGPFEDALLRNARDVALRAGVPTAFYLLSDVLEGNAPRCPAYLFVNAFCLTEGERTRLHSILVEQQAAAIWLYAPGYIAADAGVENVASTVRMAVKAFEEPAAAGSTFLLSGRWMEREDTFGEAAILQPLFYIDAPEADVLAQYTASQKPSVAMSFFEEGWASVFCAEPGLTVPLLREILSILELHVYYGETAKPFQDAVYFGPVLMAIHAKGNGERSISLGTTCDIQDLLAPEIGWPRKRSFSLPMQTGQTRLISLFPVEAALSPNGETSPEEEASVEEEAPRPGAVAGVE